MKMFMLKSFFIAALMFLSVLFGMQQANDGIHRMKGFEDSNFKGAFTVEEDTGGELQVSVLGNSHDLEEKKEQLESMKAYNFFSSLGKGLADTISSLTEKTIEFITKQLNS